MLVAHTTGKGRSDKVRLFRAEKSYAVKCGKWYFEFEAVTVGEMRVGWARPDCRPDIPLGADDLAFVFNGFKVCCIFFLLKSTMNNIVQFQKLILQLLYVESKSKRPDALSKVR